MTDGQVSSQSLAAYRFLFGALNAIGLIRFWWLGWIERAFVEPQFHFKYFGFEWVTLWPAPGIYVHFAALVAVSIFLALGLFTRVMSVLFFLGFLYIELLDLSNYLNHYYLITLLAFLNMFLPLGVRWSIDAAIAPSRRREVVPRWTISVLRLQLATVYVFAGFAKLTSDWLLRAQPMNIWLSNRTDFPIIGTWFNQFPVQIGMSWAGFLFDLTIPFWLMRARTRPYAYLAVIGFHLMTYLLFPIGMFPFIMIGTTLVFFEADWPLRAWHSIKTLMRGSIWIPLREFFRRRPERVHGRAAMSSWVHASLAIYFLVQWTVPLRHFLYPGNVLWSEQGMRFSWKVMVREKNGEAIFRIEDRATGRRQYVSPSDYLLRHQETEMSGSPDMLVQFAHFLKHRFSEEGRDVAVFAETATSFNGRARAALVDPNVDLSAVKDSLFAQPWIRPTPAGEPRRLMVGGGR